MPGWDVERREGMKLENLGQANSKSSTAGRSMYRVEHPDFSD